jgi:1-pyrroline-5-carboxylate dehydrogenase
MQPFGGARGPMIKRIYAKLIALTSARTIKETFVTPIDYRYPFLGNN